MARTGRPLEAKREKITLRVLPTTKQTIKKSINKQNKELSTAGKVVDERFKA